jgi:hypothetical protein
VPGVPCQVARELELVYEAAGAAERMGARPAGSKRRPVGPSTRSQAQPCRHALRADVRFGAHRRAPPSFSVGRPRAVRSPNSLSVVTSRRPSGDAAPARYSGSDLGSHGRESVQGRPLRTSLGVHPDRATALVAPPALPGLVQAMELASAVWGDAFVLGAGLLWKGEHR